MYKKINYIVGIDEVGRGPIAGPVAVCAFTCAITNYELLIANGIQETNSKLKDSKKLNKKQRQKWFEYIKKEKRKGNCGFFVSFVSAKKIDKLGIVICIQKALDKSLDNIKTNHSTLIYLDGGLHARYKYTNQKTIIKGDELHPVISCASIIAKVSRDRVMYAYAKEYPEYGFENHVGYGTKDHYKAIKKNGLTSIHRKTFIQ